MGDRSERAAAAAAAATRRTSHETNPLSSIVAARLHDRVAAAAATGGGTISHVGSVPLKDKSGHDVGTADVIAITPVPKKKISTQSLRADTGAISPGMSFASYLKTIPYETAMERTLNWLLRENFGETSAKEAGLENLAAVRKNFPFRDLHEEGIEEYETSISRCESDRGTHGRGSPPLDWDQSRLQDLYTQLLIRQAGARAFLSQNNRRVTRQGEENEDANQLISHVYKKFGLQYLHSIKAPPLQGLPDLVDANASRYGGGGRRAGVYQAPAIAKLVESNLDPLFASVPPQAPFEAPIPPDQEAARLAATHPGFPREKRTRRQATIKIGRTFSSKKPATLNLDAPYECEWKSCRDVFTTSRNLFMHVEEHVCAPGAWNLLGEAGGDGFRCYWRTCPLAEQSKMFRARYQLLYHLQNSHCGEKIHRISIQENESPLARVGDEEHDRTAALPQIGGKARRLRKSGLGDEPETPRSGSLRHATAGLLPQLKVGKKSKRSHRSHRET